MFDEDELSFAQAEFAYPFVTDSRIEEAKAEAAAMVLPFDLTNVLDYNPFVFGSLGEGDRVGTWVYYKGGVASTLAESEVNLNPGVAVIVGAEFGRYVLAFESEKHGWTYLGWVTPDTFDGIDIHYECQRWTH